MSVSRGRSVPESSSVNTVSSQVEHVDSQQTLIIAPVIAARGLMLISSSPSEMCFSAASVSAVTAVLELLVLVLESSEELERDSGLVSEVGGGGDRGRAGGRDGGGGGEERGGSSSATDITLKEEKESRPTERPERTRTDPGAIWCFVRTAVDCVCPGVPLAAPRPMAAQRLPRGEGGGQREGQVD